MEQKLHNLSQQLQDHVQHLGFLKLRGSVQHYDWGQTGKDAFIPSLLQQSAGDLPWAELWFGTHVCSGAQVQIADSWHALSDVVRAAPQTVLGAAVLPSAHQMPFLFKILSCARPLSIQTHPNTQQAQQAFAQKKYPAVYKDPLGKWEQICALSDFYLLCGFRPLQDVLQFLQSVPGALGLWPQFNRFTASKQNPLRCIFETVLKENDTVLNPLIDNWLACLKKQNAQQAFNKSQHAYWVLSCADYFKHAGFYDRGLLLMGFLNLQFLQVGQSVFLSPGQAHAYLQGCAVEVMSNSDNTLRCALTKKEILAQDVLDTLSYQSGALPVLTADAQGYFTRQCPDFNFARWTLNRDACKQIVTSGAEVVFAAKGQVVLSYNDKKQTLSAGQAVLVPAAITQYDITAQQDYSLVFCCRN